jgi:tRNA-modifying protein YgfZ
VTAVTTTKGDPLATGTAFVDLSAWRKIEVSGADTINWLDALLTADLTTLGVNGSSRALFLTPTGRVRADVTVAMPGVSVLLLQDPIQPDPIDRLLAPYVLSADVELVDRTTELCLFALPNRTQPPDAPGATYTTPSCLGPGGDLTAPMEDDDRILTSLSRALTRATDEEAEAWRVRAGLPRFGVDALPEDLPQEGGLTDAVAFGKGCFPGQEAVAKVRNLGHPRRLVRALFAARAVEPGEVVTGAGEPAGVITSAARDGEGCAVLVRIRWDARDAELKTADGGVPLLPAAAQDQA